MKKEYLEILHKVLTKTDLGLSDARVRDNFIRDLEKHLDIFYSDRKKILETYCNKDEDGKPIVTDDKYIFSEIEEVNKQIELLVAEEVDLKLSEAVKAFINKTNYKPKVGEVDIIDKILALS